MNPKFSEGEVVIVNSPYYPETNGEYEVLEVFTYKEFQTYCNGKFKNPQQTFIYKLKDYEAVGKVNPENKTDCVSEPSLRKKHNPSSMSYQELMTNLSTKIQERV